MKLDQYVPDIPQWAFIRGWYFSNNCQKMNAFQVQIGEVAVYYSMGVY